MDGLMLAHAEQDVDCRAGMEGRKERNHVVGAGGQLIWGFTPPPFCRCLATVANKKNKNFPSFFWRSFLGQLISGGVGAAGSRVRYVFPGVFVRVCCGK